VLTSLAITAGYHRLFAHRAYRAAAPVRVAFLLLAAAAWQNSALHWVLRHRRHHRDEDGDGDPHAISRGFFHAHVGWIGRAYPVAFAEFPRDLRAEPLVVWQHRRYWPLAAGMGLALPGAVGLVCGWGWGGLLWAGLARIVFTQHCSFLVNSWAHRFGRRPHSRATSARDSVVVALLTYGEGYHNFHHAFPHDYRNGARWYHWDPTKWLIRSLAAAGLARDLRRAARPTPPMRSRPLATAGRRPRPPGAAELAPSTAPSGSPPPARVSPGPGPAPAPPPASRRAAARTPAPPSRG
jgi:stearoyl-CoA desaturase (delta-9 desaturase)